MANLRPALAPAHSSRSPLLFLCCRPSHLSLGRAPALSGADLTALLCHAVSSASLASLGSLRCRGAWSWTARPSVDPPAWNAAGPRVPGLGVEQMNKMAEEFPGWLRPPVATILCRPLAGRGQPAPSRSGPALRSPCRSAVRLGFRQSSKPFWLSRESFVPWTDAPANLELSLLR